MSQDDHLDIRWRQRFANFRKARAVLGRMISVEGESEVKHLGVIHAFEMTIELGWLTLQDISKQKLNPTANARDAIKFALQQGLILDGEGWLNALKCRNRTAHTYDEVTSKEIAERIEGEFVALFDQLVLTLEHWGAEQP